MAEAAARRRLRDPRRRHRPRLPPPRERGGADAARRAASRSRGSGCTTGCSSSASEKMSKSVGNISLLHDALDEYGRDALIMFFVGGHYRQPMAFYDERLEEAAARRRPHPRGGAGACAAAPRPRTWRRSATRSSPRCADDFNTAEALAARVRLGPRGQPPRARPVGDADLREMLDVLGAGQPARRPTRRAAAGGRGAAPSSASRPAPTRDFAEADRLRDELARAGWEVRDGADGPELDARAARDRLRPQPGARGAPRAARAVHAVWATARAARLELAGAAVDVDGRADEAALSARCGLGRATRASARDVDAYPYADAAELLAAPDPLIVALDEVTGPAEPRRDLPHGRGRRARPAWSSPSAARPRSRRRSARRRRARSSTCAIARVRNLADFLGRRQGGRLLVLRRRRRRDARRTTRPDYRGGVVLVLGAEGRGLRPRVAAACDDLVALPVRGRIESLNVERRGGRSAVRDLAAQRAA